MVLRGFIKMSDTQDKILQGLWNVFQGFWMVFGIIYTFISFWAAVFALTDRPVDIGFIEAMMFHQKTIITVTLCFTVPIVLYWTYSYYFERDD